MTKTICYDVFCGIDDKIILRTLIVLELVATVAIAAALVSGASLTGTEMLNILLYPVEF